MQDDDLAVRRHRIELGAGDMALFGQRLIVILPDHPPAARGNRAGVDEGKIGRASCRERVCQYVLISVVAVSLKKYKKISDNIISNKIHDLMFTIITSPIH